MKKKAFTQFGAAAVITALLLGTAAAFPASAAVDIQLMGDLDGDQDVTAVDALSALKIYADDMSQLASNAVSAENYTADIDMNGEISLQDALSILGYYSKTLVGMKPLWADFREVSYSDGSGGISVEDGQYVPGTPAIGYVQKQMYAEIGCASGAPGEDVTVPVYVAGLEGLAGVCMWLTPPEGIELTNIAFNAELIERANGICDDMPFVTNLSNGAAVWVADGGLNQDIADGTVLLEYTYHIPEDAEPGTHYLLMLEPGHTEFVLVNGSACEEYGCTILSGVIAVK